MEEKRWPKRLLFVAALPLSVFLFVRFFWSALHTVRRARSDWQNELPRLLLFGYLVLGTAMFLWWQTGTGMTPGKNSSIKALYNAHLVAPLVVTPLFAPLRKPARTPLLFWTLLIGAVSLPLVIFFPQW